MLTKAEALELVESKLKSGVKASYDVVIVESLTVERDFGWVFCWNSREYLETGDYRKALCGNLPILVNRHTGCLRYICFHSTLEESIAEYEAELAGHKLPTRYEKLLESHQLRRRKQNHRWRSMFKSGRKVFPSSTRLLCCKISLALV